MSIVDAGGAEKSQKELEEQLRASEITQKNDYFKKILISDVNPVSIEQFKTQPSGSNSPEAIDKYPTEIRALILIQQFQTKNTAGAKVHDPKQVLAKLGDTIAGMKGQDSKEISKALDNAEEILLQTIKLSGMDYAELTTEGSALNVAYNDMLKKISDAAPQDAVDNFSKNIESKTKEFSVSLTDAKSTCDQLIKTENGKQVTSVNDFIAELNPRFLIGGYNQAKFKSMAKAIAHDLTQYQVNQFNSSGISESGLNQQAPFFNGISNTIATDILKSDNPQHMENKVRLYIAVARECVKNNDFVSAHAIQSALNQGPVDRLKLVDNLPGKPRSELRELNELFSLSDGMGNMKKAIAAVPADQPLLQSNTTMLGDYTGALENASYLYSTDSTDTKTVSFNEDRPKIMAKTFLPAVANKANLEGFQSEPPKTDFVNLVFMGNKLTSDELYEISQHIKQRGQPIDPNKFKDVPKIDGLQASDLVALTSTAPAPSDEVLIEADDPADEQGIEQLVEIDPSKADEVIYIGPEPGQEQKIGQEVPPLNLSQVQRQEDPSPKMPRGVPKLDMSRVPRNLDLSDVQTYEQKPKDKSPETKRQGPEQQAQEPKQEQKKERKHHHKKSSHRKHNSSGHHKRRKKKQEKQAPESAASLGSSRHMTTQFSQMMERQRQQSQQDVSPTLQQRVEQSQQQEAPQQKQESTRPSRGKVGGLTSMFEAKIKQMEQESRNQRAPTAKIDDDAPKQSTKRGNKR